MLKLKWNEKKFKSFEKKMNKIANDLSKATSKGVLKASQNTQAVAIRLLGNGTGIMAELVEMNSGKVKARVYTDKVQLFWACFREFGTGEYAELEHIGTTKTFIESGYEFWYIPVDKVDRPLNYPIKEFSGKKFYLAHGAKPQPFMRPAGIQTREQNIEIVRKAIKDFLREAV